MTTIDKPIIFFDGVCGLCNSFADWVIKRDKDEQFYFAPIQGETAKALIGTLGDDAGEWSIIYVNKANKTLYASDAVLDIFNDLGGGWRILAWSRILPRGFREFFYRIVARNRYKWFKKRDSCRLPTKEEQQRFLP